MLWLAHALSASPGVAGYMHAHNLAHALQRAVDVIFDTNPSPPSSTSRNTAGTSSHAAGSTHVEEFEVDDSEQEGLLSGRASGRQFNRVVCILYLIACLHLNRIILRRNPRMLWCRTSSDLYGFSSQLLLFRTHCYALYSAHFTYPFLFQQSRRHSPSRA